jgi:hypothetical protein
MSQEENAKQIVEAMTEYVTRKLRPLEQRIADLEGAQQKTLADAFQGAWLPRALYRRGSLVQYGGSCWLALEETDGRPGEAPGWRLLVKSGRDAK